MLKDQDTQTAIMGLAPTEAGRRTLELGKGESEVEMLQGGRSSHLSHLPSFQVRSAFISAADYD